MANFKQLKVQLCRVSIFCWDSTIKAKRIAVATRCGLFVTNISVFVTSAWYFVFEAQTLREHSESLLFVLSALFVLWWYSAFLFQFGKYEALLDELNSMIEKRKTDPTVHLIYENTNINIEWMTQKLLFFFRIIRLLYIFIPAIVSLFNYITEFSNESFLQVYPASYPFNWKTPLGYVACVLIQLFTVNIISEFYAAVLVLMIEVCMMIANFAIDIKEKLHQFNRILIPSNDEEFTAEDQVILKKKLNEIIEFHSEAREFANRFSDVNSAIVFACPMYTIAVFGSLVLQINLLTKSGDIVGIVQIAVFVIGAMFPFFLFCHFGGKITHEFEDIGDTIYQLEWYRLPLDMQKDLKIVIALTQKRIYMRGYGDTRTTHSVFKKILKNKFYYFMFTQRF